MMNKKYRKAVILIVEDDSVMFQLAEIMFKRANVVNSIQHVGDADAALDFLYKRNGYEDAPTPDLVYLDMYMPRMKGTELLQIMYEDPELSKIPTMMLTSSEADIDMEVASEYGAVGYVMKPLSPAKIMETYLYNEKIKLQFVVEDVDGS